MLIKAPSILFKHTRVSDIFHNSLQNRRSTRKILTILPITEEKLASTDCSPAIRRRARAMNKIAETYFMVITVFKWKPKETNFNKQFQSFYSAPVYYEIKSISLLSCY